MKVPSRASRINEPVLERDKKFCERWLTHHDAFKAYKEAGFFQRGGAVERSIKKLAQFRPYLERLQPNIEQRVLKKVSYERADLLRGMALIANANALDYLKLVDGIPVLKPIYELTHDQAAALDEVTINPQTGHMGYRLPGAKTRLSALIALGEQAAGFKRPDTTHNHMHLHDIPLDKIRALKEQLIAAVGRDQARLVFGMTEEDQANG